MQKNGYNCLEVEINKKSTFWKLKNSARSRLYENCFRKSNRHINLRNLVKLKF